MYKLKAIGDRVNALHRSGKDFVKTEIHVYNAQSFIDTGHLVESDKPGYPICVDNEWYFEGEEEKPRSRRKVSK